MNKKHNKQFKSEDDERELRVNEDLSERFTAEDFHDAAFPKLKPSTHPVSIRIPGHLLARVMERANERNVSYQSLLKEYIAKGLEE